MTTRRAFIGSLIALPVAAALPSIGMPDPWSAWSRHLEQGPWILIGNSPALAQSAGRGSINVHLFSDITVIPEDGWHYLGAYNLEHRNSKELSFRFPHTFEAGCFHNLHIRVEESGHAWIDFAYVADPGPISVDFVHKSWKAYMASEVEPHPWLIEG